MAGHVLKRRRLVNPRTRRRNMSAKQIKYFGTRAQKNALKRRRKRNAPRPWSALYHKRYGGKRRRNQPTGVTQAIHRVERAAEDAIESVTGSVGLTNRGRRRKNVGEIITVLPAAMNRGHRRRNRGMAATKNRRRNRSRANYPRRRNRIHHRKHNRRTVMNVRSRRHNRAHNVRRRRHNPRVVVRYRNRRMNRRHNRGHRRRNPAWLQGDVGAVVGVLGGAAVTTIITGMLPSSINTGWPGYIATGVAAVVQGQVFGKVFKNDKFGNWMTVGGLVILALKVANDMFPQLQLPLALTGNSSSGMGLITSSNFYVPQVNLPGSMATFVTPAGIPVAAPVATTGGGKLSGLGYQGLRTIRRVGRMR